MPEYKSNVFGTALAHYLDERDLTQERFADQVGVEQQTISKWIRGATLPRAGNVRKMEQVLGLPNGRLWNLVFGVDDGNTATHVDEDEKAQTETQPAGLSRRWSDLTEAQRAAVNAVIDEMAGEE